MILKRLGQFLSIKSVEENMFEKGALGKQSEKGIREVWTATAEMLGGTDMDAWDQGACFHNYFLKCTVLAPVGKFNLMRAHSTFYPRWQRDPTDPLHKLGKKTPGSLCLRAQRPGNR